MNAYSLSVLHGFVALLNMTAATLVARSVCAAIGVSCYILLPRFS